MRISSDFSRALVDQSPRKIAQDRPLQGGFDGDRDFSHSLQELRIAMPGLRNNHLARAEIWCGCRLSTHLGRSPQLS
jgi:hypothetical protein